jgi:hypothetical protein
METADHDRFADPIAHGPVRKDRPFFHRRSARNGGFLLPANGSADYIHYDAPAT